VSTEDVDVSTEDVVVSTAVVVSVGVGDEVVVSTADVVVSTAVVVSAGVGDAVVVVSTAVAVEVVPADVVSAAVVVAAVVVVSTAVVVVAVVSVTVVVVTAGSVVPSTSAAEAFAASASQMKRADATVASRRPTDFELRVWRRMGGGVFNRRSEVARVGRCPCRTDSYLLLVRNSISKTTNPLRLGCAAPYVRCACVRNATEATRNPLGQRPTVRREGAPKPGSIIC
jgi:hypothetical protein